MKKAVFTLNIGNYSPEIRALTYPLMKFYAHRIGAEFREITTRKWPDWPVVYEKLQLHELARDYDWFYFFDADTLIHPECIDFSWYLPDDCIAHNGVDQAAIRFRFDEDFARDTKRSIGTCGWCVLTPRKCIGLWEPTKQTKAEVMDACYPTVSELATGLIDKGHLFDDYVKSRNLARNGYKHATFKDLLPQIGLEGAEFFFHIYTVSPREKVLQMEQTIARWNVGSFIPGYKRSLRSRLGPA